MIRAYIRVSTLGQANDGFGLDAQVSAIQKFCLSEFGDEFVCFYHDTGVSGTVPIYERPMGSVLLNDVQEGDTIVAFSVSRISRMVWISSKFLHDMKEKGVGVICLDAKEASANPSGSFMFHILASVSQQDRENILKITEAGREEKRKKGGDLGGTVQPWQKRDGKEIVNDSEKIERILMVREFLILRKSYKEISGEVGVSNGTITNWKKQLDIKTSPMNQALEEYEQTKNKGKE